MGRLRRPKTTAFPNVKEYGGGRSWKADVARITRRARAGKPITLYRGDVYGQWGRSGKTPRTPAVMKGQAWTTSPHMALEFARSANIGDKGRLYSIKVPGRELKTLGRRRVLPSSEHGKWDHMSGGVGARRASGDWFKRDKWSVMTDPGGYRGDSRPRLRLELRPNSDRPDLKPKVVGTVDMRAGGGPLNRIVSRIVQKNLDPWQRDNIWGEKGAARFDAKGHVRLTRRLERRRGAAARGGGA